MRQWSSLFTTLFILSAQSDVGNSCPEDRLLWMGLRRRGIIYTYFGETIFGGITMCQCLKEWKQKNQGADLSKWLDDLKGFFQSKGFWDSMELWVQVGATGNADSSSLQRSFLCRWRWWEGKGELTSQLVISYLFQPFKQALRNNFQLFVISHTFPALRIFPQWPLWPTGTIQPSPHPWREKLLCKGLQYSRESWKTSRKQIPRIYYL